jgi:hypothetical protein
MFLMASDLTAGSGGWCCWEQAPDGLEVFIRFADRSGRLVIVELCMASDAFSTDLLRQIPLGRIEAIANGDRADRIRQLIDVPGPEILPGLRESLFHQTHPALQRESSIAGTARIQSLRHTLRLTPEQWAIADGRRRPYPDEFYAAVAQLYKNAARHSRAPAALIADANGVPLTTVHRWVRIARKRRHLPPASPGKAG